MRRVRGKRVANWVYPQHRAPPCRGGWSWVTLYQVFWSLPWWGFGAPSAIAVLAVVSWRLFEFWAPIPFGGLGYLSLRA